jgi:hypothetical protein
MYGINKLNEVKCGWKIKTLVELDFFGFGLAQFALVW